MIFDRQDDLAASELLWPNGLFIAPGLTTWETPTLVNAWFMRRFNSCEWETTASLAFAYSAYALHGPATESGPSPGCRRSSARRSIFGSESGAVRRSGHGSQSAVASAVSQVVWTTRAAFYHVR